MRRTLARTLLVASLFASPLLADRANDVAREYLTTACADGKERVGVYDASRDAFVDLTVQSRATEATWDVSRLLPYCAEQQLTMFHCHTTNDVFSSFPSYLDLPLAASIEYDCAAYAAEQDVLPPTIIHRVLPVPGNGTITEYALTEPLARIRHLGAAQGKAARAASQDMVSRKEERNRAEAMRWIRDTLFTRFAADLQGFMEASCPTARTAHEFSTCGAITLERFLQARAGDEHYRITTQRTAPRSVTLREALDSDHDWEFLTWKARPQVFILASDLHKAQASLGRISYFVEVEPGRVPPLDTIVQNAAGYDLTSEDIARFYNVAQQSDERLRVEEEQLHTTLVSYGILRPAGAGWTGNGHVLITFPPAHPRKRDIFLHEVSHALYFTDERYRHIADEFQKRQMSPDDLRVIAQSLVAFGYDGKNEYLVRNETQAYLAMDGLFSLVMAARNVAPTKDILSYLVTRNCELLFPDCPLIGLVDKYRRAVAPYFEGLLDDPQQ